MYPIYILKILLYNYCKEVMALDFSALYNEIKDEIITLRRSIHQNPELAFEAYRTAQTICNFLDKHKIAHTDGIAKTGVCAVIGNRSKDAVLIRADMDALPVTENTGAPFASQVHGKMHACGHDIHISAALAAAYMLKHIESELDVCVKIVFQPAEETTGGAQIMIDEGVLENPTVTSAIGGHVTGEIPTGKVWLKDGALMASPDDFTVTFTGKSTHGAQPEKGISPILPACEFVLEIGELIKKKTGYDKDCVFSICTVSGGNSVNVIPDEARVIGTFRSFSKKSREDASRVIADTADEIAKKHGAKAESVYNFLYPPLINDSKMTEKMRCTLKNVIGENNIIDLKKPLMTGEDFSYFASAVPSVFIWYGASADGKGAPLHSDKFNPDEGAIEVAAKVFCDFVTREALK